MTCPRCAPYCDQLAPDEEIACAWCAETPPSVPERAPAGPVPRPEPLPGAGVAPARSRRVVAPEPLPASEGPRLRTIRPRGAVLRAGVGDRDDPLAVLRRETAGLLVALDAAERLAAVSGGSGIDYASPLVQRSPSAPTPQSVGRAADLARWASQRIESLRLVPLRGPSSVRDVSVGAVLGWIAQHVPPEPWPVLVGSRDALGERLAREFVRRVVLGEWVRAESRGVAAPIRRQAADQQRTVGLAILRLVLARWADRTSGSSSSSEPGADVATSA